MIDQVGTPGSIRFFTDTRDSRTRHRIMNYQFLDSRAQNLLLTLNANFKCDHYTEGENYYIAAAARLQNKISIRSA